jgi:hypothetical protein
MCVACATSFASQEDCGLSDPRPWNSPSAGCRFRDALLGAAEDCALSHSAAFKSVGVPGRQAAIGATGSPTSTHAQSGQDAIRNRYAQCRSVRRAETAERIGTQLASAVKRWLR